jgi:zinc transporter ZupT
VFDLHEANLSNGTTSITQAEAYGYGFIMIFIISLTSLLGVSIVPLLRSNSRLATVYKYLITLLISMGVAALVSDALLHLLPSALNLSSHEHKEDEEFGEDKGMDEREVVWRMCGVLGGVASFFVLELLLHACSARLGHQHSHRVPSTSDSRPTNIFSPSETVALITSHNDPSPDNQVLSSATCQHDNTSSSDALKQQQQSLVESAHDYGTVEDDTTETTHKGQAWGRLVAPITSIKPLAWVIIIGDSLHNFTDGLAVGVAISQSLGLGLSTAIAILFHEIPHELSDYAILLHTGMSWYKALLLNFLSAITALGGFFIGVAIGTDSKATNGWLLAVIAGQFLYIALVDLLPEVLHSRDTGWEKAAQVVMTLIGLALGFSILLLIALFEDSINIFSDG